MEVEQKKELSIYQSAEGADHSQEKSVTQAYMGAQEQSRSSGSPDKKFQPLTSMSTTMTFREPLVVNRSQPQHSSGSQRYNTLSELLPAHDMIRCQESMLNQGTNNPGLLEESSETMKSNSMHEFAQLAGYLQTRVVPPANPGANGPQEEMLCDDLSLFNRNMLKIDVARAQQNTSSILAVLHQHTQERFTIELESQGTDFHTVFKNQLLSLTENKDLLVTSVVAILEVRGFVLKDQVISFFSSRTKSFVAVAKRPIPSDAIIPGTEIEQNGRLSLKIWPTELLSESLLLDLDLQQKPHQTVQEGTPLAVGGHPDCLAEHTLKSSYDGCAGENNGKHILPSLSSGTSYGKEPIFENTIEQILGNIERSHIGEINKEPSHDSFIESKRFRKEIEDRLFGGKLRSSGIFGSNCAKSTTHPRIQGIRRLEPMS